MWDIGTELFWFEFLPDSRAWLHSGKFVAKSGKVITIQQQGQRFQGELDPLPGVDINEAVMCATLWVVGELQAGRMTTSKATAWVLCIGRMATRYMESLRPGFTAESEELDRLTQDDEEEA